MESQEPITLPDEIDLQELAVRVILYFKKHALFIVISVFVGTGLSVTAYFYLPKVFESRMIIMSDILTEPYTRQINESLVNLIKERNYEALASRLNLSEEEASELHSLEIESAKKEKPNDKEAEQTIFIITADIGDKEILPKLQNGFVQFLRNIEYVKIRVRQRVNLNTKMIERIGLEIHSLDSVKKRLFLGQPVYSKSSEMLLVDPTNIYTKIIELSREQISYKNALELSDSIQLIEGFTVFQKPAQPKLSILMMIGFSLGLLFSLGFLVITRLFKLASTQLS